MNYKTELGKVEIVKANDIPMRLSVFVHSIPLDDDGAELLQYMVKQEYMIEKANFPDWLNLNKIPTAIQIKNYMQKYMTEIIVPAQTRLDQLQVQTNTQFPEFEREQVVETVMEIEITDTILELTK